MISRVVKWVTNPRQRFLSLAARGFYKNMDDEEYIRRKYKVVLDKNINLDDPKTFNEKNNWRKLYDRRPEYTDMVDKYRVKEIIKNRVGEEYAFKLLGVWEDPEDIDLTSLPEKFVLKPNHSGGVIVCRNKDEFCMKSVVRYLKKQQKIDFFTFNREWPYKNVKRKIICEEYMGENLTDYKNYCFNGKVYYTFVWENASRKDGLKPEAYFCGAYDREWKKSEIEIGYPTLHKDIKKPDCYEKLVRVAENMSRGIPFVRIDCYIIDNHVYVGECTFFPWGGFELFIDEKYDKMLGNLEVLPGRMITGID